jgi:hypothetical protein
MRAWMSALVFRLLEADRQSTASTCSGREPQSPARRETPGSSVHLRLRNRRWLARRAGRSARRPPAHALALEAALCDGLIVAVELDAEKPAAEHPGRQQCRAGAGERIQHQAAVGRERLDQREEGLLRRVQPVQSSTSPMAYSGSLGRPLARNHAPMSRFSACANWSGGAGQGNTPGAVRMPDAHGPTDTGPRLPRSEGLAYRAFRRLRAGLAEAFGIA